MFKEDELMSRFRGEEKLIARTADFKRAVIRFNEQVYFITGYGGSNAVLIIGEESCIMVAARWTRRFCEIIARTPSFPQLGRSQLISDVFARRSAL